MKPTARFSMAARLTLGFGTILLTASVQRVSAMVTSITAKATQQLSHIEEANRLVGQLDVVAHQNAALAEESAAAAASLRQQASHLSGLVHRFKLGKETSIFSS